MAMSKCLGTMVVISTMYLMRRASKSPSMHPSCKSWAREFAWFGQRDRKKTETQVPSHA